MINTHTQGFSIMGIFITFEGIDGCGKSTQIVLLQKNLEEHGYPIVLTREPGGTEISEKIRSLILGVENTSMSTKCELLLYLAARAQHVDETIIPELLKDKIVLSDRYEEATYAYQGSGRGVNLDMLMSLNNFATSNVTPDLTFIIDISIEESEARWKKSGKIRDRLEMNNRSFFKRVRKGYQDRAAMHPERIALLDGRYNIAELEKQILDKSLEVIKGKQFNW